MTGIVTQLPIEIPKDKIAELCQRYHISKLSLFGSILRNDFRPNSDIDILVEFEPGYTPGFEFIDIQDELSEVLGRPVDLNTPQDISRYFRDQVLAEAQVQYVKNR
ncbi:MAG: nucleotidyltransferase family protein [Scytonema sp. PMC 1069.18]|nr:nucleotidyltransferase family protein [Scytonema sp. PMC 1069.18]MEC4885633.1 nucleotidyltransferase family protein [Scytonema sp. PMC 1070.18]